MQRYSICVSCLALETGHDPTGAAAIAKFLICFMMIGVIGIFTPLVVVGIGVIVYEATSRVYDEAERWLTRR